MTRDWLGEGIATAMGMLHVGGLDLDDAEQVKERLQSGFPAEDFKRAGGGGDLYTDVEQERYQQLHAGAIQTTTSIELLDREAEIGIPVGWAACQPGQLRNIPDNEDGATVRAFLYRPDADPSAGHSLQALAVRDDPRHAQFWHRKPDPELWLLRAEHRTGLRAVERAVCVRLGGERAFYWQLAGTKAGAAVGRPDQSVIEVRSAQLWCPLPSGTVQLLLVAGDRAREGLAGPRHARRLVALAPDDIRTRRQVTGKVNATSSNNRPSPFRGLGGPSAPRAPFLQASPLRHAVQQPSSQARPEILPSPGTNEPHVDRRAKVRGCAVAPATARSH